VGCAARPWRTRTQPRQACVRAGWGDLHVSQTAGLQQGWQQPVPAPTQGTSWGLCMRAFACGPLHVGLCTRAFARGLLHTGLCTRAVARGPLHAGLYTRASCTGACAPKRRACLAGRIRLLAMSCRGACVPARHSVQLQGCVQASQALGEAGGVHARQPGTRCSCGGECKS